MITMFQKIVYWVGEMLRALDTPLLDLGSFLNTQMATYISSSKGSIMLICGAYVCTFRQNTHTH